MDDSEVLAVIREVGYAFREREMPCLWFVTQPQEHAAVLQVLLGAAARDLLAEAGISDAHELEGRLCWVEADAIDSRFKRLHYPQAVAEAPVASG
ncbi:MAG TPA: hypothetical protein VFA07_00175 [Chthonomonadaceae bacterium]|nr:hypothetical protein [Chthonomonadaceae bacterium]